jgi:hypothetical protein
VRKGLFLSTSGFPRKITAQTANSGNMFPDELCKTRAGRCGCLPFITASGFGESRVTHNLGSGQKECPDRNILG